MLPRTRSRQDLFLESTACRYLERRSRQGGKLSLNLNGSRFPRTRAESWSKPSPGCSLGSRVVTPRLPMSKLLQIALGVFTSIGGFLEVGAIATTAQAGAAFGFQLIWAVLLGTICVTFLVEMSGRLAAVSRHTIKDALRERFGPRIYVVTLVSDLLINLMVLAAEIGGMSLALQLVTGVSFRWWAIPVGLLTWVLLWKGSFSLIENGVSLLGMVALVFVVAAYKLHPPMSKVVAG